MGGTSHFFSLAYSYQFLKSYLKLCYPIPFIQIATGLVFVCPPFLFHFPYETEDLLLLIPVKLKCL